MASVKYEAGAIVSLLTTELNALANSAAAIATTGYDNATNLYLFGYFELNATFGVAPTAGNTVDLYLVPASDGTNYADNTSGASGTTSANYYVGSFPLRAVTTAQKIGLTGPSGSGPIWLPPLPFKAFVVNKGGQALGATGHTLKMVPYRQQVI